MTSALIFVLVLVVLMYHDPCHFHQRSVFKHCIATALTLKSSCLTYLSLYELIGSRIVQWWWNPDTTQCVSATTPYLHRTTTQRNVPDQGKRWAMLNSWSSEFLKPESQIPHCLDTSAGYWTIWGSLSVSDKLCTVGCCHALVNPAPLPFCHSRHG